MAKVQVKYMYKNLLQRNRTIRFLSLATTVCSLFMILGGIIVVAVTAYFHFQFQDSLFLGVPITEMNRQGNQLLQYLSGSNTRIINILMIVSLIMGVGLALLHLVPFILGIQLYFHTNHEGIFEKEMISSLRSDAIRKAIAFGLPIFLMLLLSVQLRIWNMYFLIGYILFVLPLVIDMIQLVFCGYVCRGE